MASIEYRKVSVSSYKEYMEMASMLLDDYCKLFKQKEEIYYLL